jgi:hypothetical protein
MHNNLQKTDMSIAIYHQNSILLTMTELRPYQRLFAEYPNLKETLDLAYKSLQQENFNEAITTLVEALETETKAKIQAQTELKQLQTALKFY